MRTATGRNANFEQVTGGFFAVTGQKLLEGRTFTDDDLDARQPVAIVNAAFAQAALRQRERARPPLPDRGRQRPQPGPWRTIVGVVSTVRMLGPFNVPGVDETGFYVPFFANPVRPGRSRVRSSASSRRSS